MVFGVDVSTWPFPGPKMASTVKPIANIGEDANLPTVFSSRRSFGERAGPIIFLS
jgi:hypothetical protein